jgi:hypothetical protein
LGTWTGAVSTDGLIVLIGVLVQCLLTTTAVTIAATSNNPIISLASPYISSFTYAQSANIAVNDTLSFAATADKLLAKGNVTIASSGGLVEMTNGGIVELQGNWDDQRSNGLKYGTGSVIFSGGSTQTLSAVSSPEIFYNFQINKTAAANLLNLNKSITVAHDLTLTNGIITTGSNLFTWNNSGGTLTAPEPDYHSNSLNYTNSFIATCNSSGTPISGAWGPTVAFNGSVGFQIKNVGGADTYFPVGASFLLGDISYNVPSPNRMMINNQSGTSDYTVVVNHGDIGYTNGTTNTWKVNRIWYIKSSAAGTGKATMRLFFTKRDWNSGQWSGIENEVEGGFNYAQTALVQKDYTIDRGNFINLSSGSDIIDFTDFSTYPYNTEIYGQYKIGFSNNLTDGIAQFYRFSVVNPGSIILPVSITNLRAYQKASAIQIDWTALNELNIGHYEVQKATNGINFNSIGNVVSLNNGASQNNYSLVDTKPAQGNNFLPRKSI